MDWSLPALVARGELAADWAEALAPVAEDIAALGAWLSEETAAARGWLPEPALVFRAFQRPLAGVRVVLVGQDPYPSPGHPVGLAFAADRAVRPLPRSVANVFRELESDLGVPAPPHADLSGWADRGVLLLNRVLTVRAGAAGSHRGAGWEAVTDRALAALAERGGPLVAVLWGAAARELAPALPGVPLVTSAHPSPLSASRGFFGSRPFSRVNELLLAAGAPALDWRLDGAPDSLPAALF